MAEGQSLNFDDAGRLIVGHSVSIEAAKRDVELMREAHSRSRSQMQYLGSIPHAVAYKIKQDHGLDIINLGKFSESEKLKLGQVLRSEYPHLLNDRTKLWRSRRTTS